MSQNSDIEWTDATWNPVRGCVKVSPGCKNCYAETFAERFRGVAGHPYEQGFDPRLVPEALDAPLRWKKPRTIFVNSVSDLFGDFVPDEYLAACFGVMAATPRHTYQVLTKRADRLPRWSGWVETRAHRGAWLECMLTASDMIPEDPPRRFAEETIGPLSGPWPLPNVWLGVSVESQKYADERIPHLLATPAAVRFLSIEPLLGPVDLTPYLRSWCPACASHLLGGEHFEGRACGTCHARTERGVGWVIVGGESGPGAREMDPAWVRSIRDQCVAAKVPFFFKQWGGVRKKLRGRLLDGRTWDEMPVRTVVEQAQ